MHPVERERGSEGDRERRQGEGRTEQNVTSHRRQKMPHTAEQNGEQYNTKDKIKKRVSRCISL